MFFGENERKSKRKFWKFDFKVNVHSSLQNYSNIHREFVELSHNIFKVYSTMEKSSLNQYEIVLMKIKRVLSIKTKFVVAKKIDKFSFSRIFFRSAFSTNFFNSIRRSKKVSDFFLRVLFDRREKNGFFIVENLCSSTNKTNKSAEEEILDRTMKGSFCRVVFNERFAFCFQWSMNGTNTRWKFAKEFEKSWTARIPTLRLKVRSANK